MVHLSTQLVSFSTRECVRRYFQEAARPTEAVEVEGVPPKLGLGVCGGLVRERKMMLADKHPGDHTPMLARGCVRTFRRAD